MSYLEGTPVIVAADLFCGAGGTSEGLRRACKQLGLGLDLTAVNHWDIAIDTHSANHPYARHYCEELDSIDPRKVFPDRKLHLLVASPECTNHSNAKGGKPRDDQSRATGWHVLRWIEALYPDNVLLENVREWQDWGPLGSDDKPLKSKKGELFRAFLNGITALGYKLDYRVLCAADYGDATTRERLFVMARRGRRKIEWPDPTHVPPGWKHDLFSSNKPTWRAAREIIDWSLPGQSIFERDRPLKEKTMARIAAGLKKFGGKNAEPFLVMLYGTGKARSLDRPLPTVTASGQHIALVEPFIVEVNHGNGKDAEKGNERRVRSIDDPLKTVTCKNGYALVEPFLTKYYGTGANVESINEPLDTITTRDRFALVQPVEGEYGLDIRFRMLRSHELAAAMGFTEPGREYIFTGPHNMQVKQIGNAVAVNVAKALTYNLVKEYASTADPLAIPTLELGGPEVAYA